MSEKDAQKKITSKNTKNPIQRYVKENQRKQWVEKKIIKSDIGLF